MTTIHTHSRTIDVPELHARAQQAVGALLAAGVLPGDGVAVLLRNDFAYFEMYFAALFGGFRFVPLNWHLTASELAYILEDSASKLLLTHADFLTVAKEAARENMEVVVVPTPGDIRAAYGVDADVNRYLETDWNEFIDAHQPVTERAVPGGTVMAYTSGTTGQPKGVRRTPSPPERQARYLDLVVSWFGLRAGMKMAVTGPLYHTAPFGYTRYSLDIDCDVFFLSRFEAEPLLALIERERITHMHLVPIMFVRLLRLPDEVKQRYDLSSLESVIHGAAPCPVPVKRQMIEWWGPVIREYYGSTETSFIAVVDSKEWLERPGTVGKGVRGTVIEIHDEDGSVVGPHENGDIYVRSEVASDFDYHNHPEDRRAMQRGDFMTSGDIGYLDEEGFLFITGRRKDMIISGGVNIYPAEIESVLMAHPGIADCAVFALPDEEFGEQVAAAIQPVNDCEVTEGAIRTFLDGKLARFKMPRTMSFHDSLPRLDNGKIYKLGLRAGSSARS